MVAPSTRGGRHTLHVRASAANEVLYWAGNNMHRIDVSTGRLLSTEAVPINGDCSFSQSGTACAFACSCRVQLAACDSGKTIGAPFKKTYVEMFGHDGEAPHAGCFGFGVGLIGGGAGIGVFEVEDPAAQHSSISGYPHVIVGVDLATGNERWRSAALAHLSAYDSGVVGDRAFRGGHEGELDLFDVRDGHVLHHRNGKHVDGLVPRHLVIADAVRSQLFFSFEQESALMDTTKGTILWRATLPADAWGTVEGGSVAEYRVDAGDKPLSLLVLDRRTGAVKGRVPLPPRSSVREAADGGFYVLGKELVAYDKSGAEHARLSTVSPPNLRVGSDWASLFSNEELAILDARDLHRVALLAGSYAVQPQSSLAAQMLVYRFSGDDRHAGEAIVLSR